MTASARPDILGPDWSAETFALADDDEGAVVATLVQGAADRATDRAVLHIHGFNDYFFHTEYGDWWRTRGHTMYALDLRKYGRSLLPHQTATYVGDIDEYFEEIDAAWDRITRRDGHRQVVLSGHSTGGLVVALWADSRRPPELEGLILNSPWLDMQGPAWTRARLTDLAIDRLGRSQPMRALSRDVTGFYGRSIHRDHEGEWGFDLGWKPLDSYPVRFGWLRAIRAAHARIHAGLAVAAPILVLSSDRSARPTGMDDPVVNTTDIVLDVTQIRRWSPSLGPHVTSVAISGAIHDVVLSRQPVRTVVYAEIARWLRAYVDTPVREEDQNH